MQVDEFPAIDPNEDLTKILPIQQKRTIALVNHFIMNTVSHLNKFAQSCESRFMDFEYKVQKIEASLLILESQLSSISGLETSQNSINQNKSSETAASDLPEVTNKAEENSLTEEGSETCETGSGSQEGMKAKEDPRFRKFFKMVQFGVPSPAVKMKMQNEGIDPNILDTPEAVIPGLAQDLLKNESDENSD